MNINIDVTTVFWKLVEYAPAYLIGFYFGYRWREEK